MSSMSENPGDRVEERQQQQKGPEAFLASEERKDLQRKLSFPEDLPPKFKNWIQDYIAVNIPQIPISQIVGYERFLDAQVTVHQAESVSASENTSSTSYTDLTTPGPELTDLLPGTYAISFGCVCWSDTRGQEATASLEINGVTATDLDKIVNADDASGLASVSRVVGKTLSEETNTITMKYKTHNAGTGIFSDRWLIAIRTGPVPE